MWQCSSLRMECAAKTPTLVLANWITPDDFHKYLCIQDMVRTNGLRTRPEKNWLRDRYLGTSISVPFNQPRDFQVVVTANRHGVCVAQSVILLAYQIHFRFWFRPVRIPVCSHHSQAAPSAQCLIKGAGGTAFLIGPFRTT